jgi:hypothetical protein
MGVALPIQETLKLAGSKFEQPPIFLYIIIVSVSRRHFLFNSIGLIFYLFRNYISSQTHSVSRPYYLFSILLMPEQ